MITHHELYDFGTMYFKFRGAFIEQLILLYNNWYAPHAPHFAIGIIPAPVAGSACGLI
jgi:hypothetical protein